MKYVIFHPDRPGVLLDPVITENILSAANRGRVTDAGRRLMLVPDKRGTHRDKDKIRFQGFGRVKKSECIPLKSLAS